MKNLEILEKNLAMSNVDRSDLIAKLSEENIFQFSQVKVLALQAIGDICMLNTLENEVLQYVILKNAERSSLQKITDLYE